MQMVKTNAKQNFFSFNYDRVFKAIFCSEEAKKKVILVGQKRALFTAVHRNDTIQRNTILSKRIRDVFEKMKQKEQKAVKQEEVEQLTL